ncbi:MAG: MbcA/ParS/Xre antitoxin family protein [Gemmatimonadota bacterium]|nr:MbcA/ParS/Xre antitoxin family protein [Gemmatimonadota bacterium]
MEHRRLRIVKPAHAVASSPAADAAHAPVRIDTLTGDERSTLGAAGFRTFLALADNWQLTVNERTRLLGDIADSTYHKWRSGKIGELSRDQLERLSLVLGIYKALRLIFSDEATGTRWLRGANTESLFAGRSPLERMLNGSIDDLYAVRRYLDAWRGGWP